MALDPSQMSTEELLQELSALENTSAHEHLTPGPEPTPFAYQQVLDEMTKTQKARAMVGQGMNKAYTSIMNLIPGIEREPVWGQDVTARGMEERALGPDKALMMQPGGPALSMTGEALTLTPTMMGMTGALSRIPRAGEMLFSTPMRRALTEGSIQGGIMAPPGHKAEGVIYGAGAGAALPAAAWVGRKIARGVEPTPWAREALERGVDLQVGQMNPNSTLGGIQRGWLSDLPIIGKRYRAGDVRAYEQWKQAVFQDVAAPGEVIAKNENLGQMLDDAYNTYKPAYDQVKGFEVYPYILNTNGPNKPLRVAFKEVVRTPGTYEDSARQAVGKFLDQKMTRLSNLKRKPSSDDFLEMRSEVRDEIRRLRKSNSPNAGDKADLLENAEDQLTAVIESQLPSGPMANLKSIDQQYAKYKVLEDAMWRANGSGAKLMPGHITAAVRASTSKGRFARGHGLMREYADQADELFSTPGGPAQPGDQLAASVLPVAAGTLHPGATAAVLSPLLALTGTRLGRRVAAGMTKPQQGLQSLTDRIVGATQSELARKYGVAPGTFARIGAREAIGPTIKTSSTEVPNQVLDVASTDLARVRDLLPQLRYSE